MISILHIRARRILAVAAAILAFGAPAMATPSIVIDAPSGQVLEQDQATASWFPASTTKLMTVYVALDAVRAHRLSMDTPIAMSPRAARMAPSKMGFKPGSEVTLRNALVMLMVKSANDIAVAVAEGVSGSVEAFADEMNRSSAALGMSQSNWVNPNGLPDARQVTSARDLAILGRALLVDFPEHAWLFNIGAMQLGNSVIPTHNGLLGRYPGADGMKTGFTCPAGFNIVASATHGGRKLIAVVLGAPSANARTAKAAALLDRAFQSGSPQGSVASLPAFGVSAAPDMRNTVCRRRGKATQEFLAEVEDMNIPLGGDSAAFGLFGGGAPQQINVKDIARLPRPQFEPVAVYAGRAPGYEGPVARIRPAGTPIGTEPDVAAFSSVSEPADAASPIPKPKGETKSLRGRHAKQAQSAPPAEPAAEAAPAPGKAKAAAAKGEAKKKHAAPAKKKPVAKEKKPAAKSAKPAHEKTAHGHGKPKGKAAE
jgi:D-alanyl-D-alanine carboxypeptidase